MVHSLSTYLTFSRKVLDVLAEVATKKPQLILDIAFPVFLAELPDSETSETRDLVRKRKSYQAVLEALAQISSERVIFEVLLRRLFSKLDIILSSIFPLHLKPNCRLYVVNKLPTCNPWDHISHSAE